MSLNTDNLTTEEINEINKEVNDDVSNIGDVDDINQEMPSMERLAQLREMLDKMPRDQAMELLSNLAKGNNSINPNNNMFTGISENNIKQQTLKQKLQQAKFNRMSKGSQKNMQQKYTEKMEKMEKMKATQENETPHECGHDCGHTH